MTKDTLPELDYEFWSKLDSWNFKDAAFLIHGMDPFDFKHMQFNTKEVPTQPELKIAYKTFLLLKNVMHEQAHHGQSAHPYRIARIALTKQLPISEELILLLNKRSAQEQEEKNEKRERDQSTYSPISRSVSSSQKNVRNDQLKELSTRERRTLLKAIGILTLLLMENHKRADQFKLSDRPNAFRIAEAILNKAEKLGISAEGIKSLDRKIKEALDFLEEEEGVY